MTTAIPARVLAAASLAGVVGGMTVATVAADTVDNPSVQPIGTAATLVEGPITQGWTISDFQPSQDAIGYQPEGTLWEATATDEAIQGAVIPVIMSFGARSPGGQIYPALFTVGTPQGLSPFPIGEGQRATGKIYFDVTGDPPDAVVYQSGDQPLLTWVTKAPPPRASSGRGSAPAPAAPVAPQRPAPAVPRRPVPPGGETPPLPVNSQGTPLPADAPEVSAPGPGSGEAGGPGAVSSPR